MVGLTQIDFMLKMPGLRGDDEKTEFIEVPVRMLWKMGGMKLSRQTAAALC